MDGSKEYTELQSLHYDQTSVSIDVHSQSKKNATNANKVTENNVPAVTTSVVPSSSGTCHSTSRSGVLK